MPHRRMNRGCRDPRHRRLARPGIGPLHQGHCRQSANRPGLQNPPWNRRVEPRSFRCRGGCIPGVGNLDGVRITRSIRGAFGSIGRSPVGRVALGSQISRRDAQHGLPLVGAGSQWQDQEEGQGRCPESSVPVSVQGAAGIVHVPCPVRASGRPRRPSTSVRNPGTCSGLVT